ncbi:MAG: hypothetical protein AB7I25_08470 [Vicinamibacterales bacterium]
MTRLLPSMRALAFGCAMAWLGTAVLGQAAARPWKTPRTAWDDPDLQGFWTNIGESFTPLERPVSMGTRTVINDAEWQERLAAYNRMANGRSEVAPPSRQASRIIDPPNGRFPPLTPEGVRRAAALKAAEARMEGPEDAPLYTRCMTRGILTMLPTFSNQHYEIVQSPGWVAILYEHVRVVRTIPLDGRPHVDDAIRTWMGDPRGRWEGDTLVVETTNFRDGTLDAGFVASDALRVVERFRRTSASGMEWQATLTDPTMYTAPVTVSLPLTRDLETDQILEYACHEGNERILEMKLSTARWKEREAPKAK